MTITLLDKHGAFAVLQDMPSLMKISSDAEKKQFRNELKRLVESHINSPSIICWVPFNAQGSQRALGDPFNVFAGIAG